MYPLVLCAVAASCERLVTVVAFEWFLSSMRSLVPCAVAAVCERLVTVVAFEWFLSSMHALVICAVAIAVRIQVLQRQVAHLVLLLFDHCIIDKSSMSDCRCSSCRNCVGVDSVAAQVRQVCIMIVGKVLVAPFDWTNERGSRIYRCMKTITTSLHFS